MKEMLKQRSWIRKSVENIMKTCSEEICEILSLRKLLSKTSVRKYESISKSVTKDERVHGLFQFYGASRTAGGQEGWYKYRIYHKIAWRIWNMQETC